MATAIVGSLIWAGSQAGRFLEAPATTPSQADVLVVLGGDVGDRTVAAVRLYAAGVAPRVLITGLEASPAQARRAYLDWRAQMLVEGGIPADRIIHDVESGNSWQEAVNTRRLMEVQGWRRALVVSDPYHMRRLSWAWGRVFEGSGLAYSLVASSPASWKSDAWWRDERSAQAVITEYIKLAYYLVKY